jgi:hypothetical protein
LPVTIERDAKNELLSVKLPDGEFEKLPEAAKDRMSSEILKQQIEQSSLPLPDTAVKQGDKWERSSESNIGGGQKLSFRSNYEYAGTIEKDGVKLEKIIGKTFEVNYSVTDNPSLQVTKSDLKVIKSDITILFDLALGAIVSNSSSTQMGGPITLVISNVEYPGKVDLTIEEIVNRQK